MLTLAADTVVASRYRVLGQLGRGGMGIVYLAEHVNTGESLALKVLLNDGDAPFDPETIERFKREARVSSKIQSEHVVRVLDADTAPELGGAPFLVMELLEGADLEKVLAREGKLPPEQVVAVLTQAARGLDQSHAVGIVHRDLKPANLFLHRRRDGSAILKVVDFGLSKVVDDATRAKMTQTGTVMGTPLYMSPEQAKGKGAAIASATDVWAVGLIAVHLLTGEVYWRATAIGELMVEIVIDEMYPPSSRWDCLPKAFDAWFAKACAREPQERFRSVGEQVRELAAALGVPVSSPSSPDLSGAPPQSHPLPRFDVATMRALPPSDPNLAAAATATPAPVTPRVVADGALTSDGFAETLAGSTASNTMPSKRRSSRAIVVAAVASLVVVGGGAFFFNATRAPSVTPRTEGSALVAPALPSNEERPSPSSAPTSSVASALATASVAAPVASEASVTTKHPASKPTSAKPRTSGASNPARVAPAASAAPWNPTAP